MQSKSQGQREKSDIQQWQAIADNSEGQDVIFGVCDEDLHQNKVHDHSFHQHPHEGDQEEIVKEHSNGLAVDGHMIR